MRGDIKGSATRTTSSLASSASHVLGYTHHIVEEFARERGFLAKRKRTEGAIANIDDSTAAAHPDSARMLAGPGDVVVFDGRCYHRGLQNEGDQPRKV